MANKHVFLALTAMVGMFCNAAFAQTSCSCATQQVTNGSGAGSQNLTDALTGRTVCVAKAGGGWENQEEHVAGGTLRDYKKGPTDPVDPSETVGTWSISGTGASTSVTHNYGSQSYTWFACTTKSNGKPVTGDPISFCSSATGSSVVNATLKAIGSGC
jgi:hypothetical protein